MHECPLKSKHARWGALLRTKVGQKWTKGTQNKRCFLCFVFVFAPALYIVCSHYFMWCLCSPPLHLKLYLMWTPELFELFAILVSTDRLLFIHRKHSQKRYSTLSLLCSCTFVWIKLILQDVKDTDSSFNSPPLMTQTDFHSWKSRKHLTAQALFYEKLRKFKRECISDFSTSWLFLWGASEEALCPSLSGSVLAERMNTSEC